MNALIKLCATFLLLLFCVQWQVLADWPCSPDISVPVVTDAGNQLNVRLASDGKNGTILVWQDRRNGSTDKLYVQRLLSSGNALWQDGGVLLSSTPGFQYYPQILADGQGGAFIVWEDNRSGLDYDIFAQRISATGVTLWNPGGIVVCNASGHQYNPQLVPDGFGGIIIVWQDKRTSPLMIDVIEQFDIYAQRINAIGRPLWQTNGSAVCVAGGDQIDPRLVQDGTGGAIIAWSDYRSGIPDIYAQHILAGGQPAWATDGIVVCGASNIQANVQVVADGSGGSIICWQDRRLGTYDNIYAQSIDASGHQRWIQDGIQIAPSTGPQYYPRMVSDGLGGAVITWQDNRLGTDYDIYAQRINSFGQNVWASGGLAVCTAQGHQYNPQLIRDDGSVLITWQDKRNGIDFDIFAQRLSLNGTALWFPNGSAVCRSVYDQFMPQLAADSLQGAIIAWADYRNATGFTDIYSQRIASNGKPAGGCYRTFSQDSLALKATKWSKRRGMPMPNAGNVRDAVFAQGVFPDGVVIGIVRRDSISRYGWEYYRSSNGVRRTFPQRGTPRPFAFRGNGYFRGALINPVPLLYNNALAAELLVLKLNISASDVAITEQQFGDLIYRDSLAFNNPLNKKSLRQIVSTVDSMLTYWRRYTTVNYYQIYATLRLINTAFAGPIDTISTTPLKIKPTKALCSVPSLISNTAPPFVLPSYQPQPVEEEVPGNFALNQNYPNPFNPYTIISFNLPEPAVVTLKVFNVLGQEVATLIDHQTFEEGAQMVEFDALRLSSGVYFYQLLSDPLDHGHRLLSNVKKMMLLK